MTDERLDQAHTRRRVDKGETSHAATDGKLTIGQGDLLVVERRFVTPALRESQWQRLGLIDSAQTPFALELQSSS